MLKVGEKAPNFSVNNQDGNTISLADLAGKKAIIYFYPKDNTPGCTKESCSLRDYNKEFIAKGFAIFGVSADSEKKHRNFIEKFDLPFDLLADENKEMIQAFHCWGPKKFMGREFEGILRTTFVLDEQGVITHIFDKVKTANHAEQIMEAIG